MSATAEQSQDPELLAAEWDLSPLLTFGHGRAEDDEAAVRRMLEEAVAAASEFSTVHAGQVASLDTTGLRDAMRELERIHELMGRAGSYAALRFATDTADPPRGALLQLVQERGTEIETKLLFFDLEWAGVEDARADELLASPELAFCRHHLRSLRRYRPHLLSESEEKLLAEKSISSQAAWGRLFSELCSALRVTLDGDEEPLDVALSRLQSPDREQRRAAAEAGQGATEPREGALSVFETYINIPAAQTHELEIDLSLPNRETAPGHFVLDLPNQPGTRDRGLTLIVHTAGGAAPPQHVITQNTATTPTFEVRMVLPS